MWPSILKYGTGLARGASRSPLYAISRSNAVAESHGRPADSNITCWFQCSYVLRSSVARYNGMMDAAWEWIQVSFNTREIATGIWLLATVIALLLWKETRSSLLQVARAAVRWNLLALFGSFVLYVAALSWILAEARLWTLAQLVPTILWLLLSGTALLARSLTIKEDEPFFRRLVFDSFTITAVFEFIVVAHTFSLHVELLFVPVFVVLGVFLGVSQTKEKFRPARIFLETIISLIVLVLLWHSLSGIWDGPDQFFTTQNGRNFLLPIFLIIGSIPAFYLWYCISNFQTASIHIGMKTFQSDELKRYAKRRFFFSFFLRPWLLQRAARQFQIIPAKRNEDVRRIVEVIRKHERQAKSPPPVDAKEGWSPYLARNFLSEHGLHTSDYHATSDDDSWSASSSNANLDEHILPNTAAFYLEGKGGVVTTLKLKGRFYNEPDPTSALRRFREIRERLVVAALGVAPDGAVLILPDDDTFALQYQNTQISARTEGFLNDNGFEWYFLLSRGAVAQ